MTAQIIDGTAIAEKVREEVGLGVEKMKAETGYSPGLATVLVGDDVVSNPNEQPFRLLQR